MRESKLLHQWFALSQAKKYCSYFHFRFSKMSMRQTAQPEFDVASVRLYGSARIQTLAIGITVCKGKEENL
jgi:hypothetical protein